MGMSNSCVKNKTRKLEPRSELCIFIGHPNGIKGGLFSNNQDKKVFVSTNATFLKHDYMKIFKLKSMIVLEELLLEHNNVPLLTRSIESQNQRTTKPNQDSSQLHRGGRVIRVTYHYRGEAELVAVNDGI